MIQVRKARLGDETAIYELIKELAVYEKEPDEVTNTISELKKHLFDDKICDALIATNKNEVVGFTLFLHIVFHLERKVSLFRRFLCQKKLPKTRYWGIAI